MACTKCMDDSVYGLAGSCCGCKHSEVAVRQYRVGIPSLLDLPLDWSAGYGQAERLADEFGEQIQSGIQNILEKKGIHLRDMRGIDILSRRAANTSKTEYPTIFITCTWDEKQLYTCIQVVRQSKLFIDEVLLGSALEHLQVTVEMISPDVFASECMPSIQNGQEQLHSSESCQSRSEDGLFTSEEEHGQSEEDKDEPIQFAVGCKRDFGPFTHEEEESDDEETEHAKGYEHVKKCSEDALFSHADDETKDEDDLQGVGLAETRFVISETPAVMDILEAPDQFSPLHSKYTTFGLVL